MRNLDLLALLGVITFAGSVSGRTLAEVTLGSPFGSGWLLSGSMNPSDLDDKHDPINYGPFVNNSGWNRSEDVQGGNGGLGSHGGGKKNCTSCHHHNHKPPKPNKPPSNDNGGDNGGQVGAPNPNDEDPFTYLEDLFTNMTTALDDLEERVITLADL